MIGTKAKFRRSNVDQRKRAKALVLAWYREQVQESAARFVNGQQVSISVTDSQSRPSVPQQPWDQSLTARGKERRVNGDGVDIESTDPHSRYGTYEHDAWLAHVRECMAHIMACSLEWHKALEMQAAGWPPEDAAEVMGCSVGMVQVLTNEGLAGVQMFMALNKPKRPQN